MCPPTCKNPDRICIQACVVGCVCESGFLLDNFGNCIPKGLCPRYGEGEPCSPNSGGYGLCVVMVLFVIQKLIHVKRYFHFLDVLGSVKILLRLLNLFFNSQTNIPEAGDIESSVIAESNNFYLNRQ